MANELLPDGLSCAWCTFALTNEDRKSHLRGEEGFALCEICRFAYDRAHAKGSWKTIEEALAENVKRRHPEDGWEMMTDGISQMRLVWLNGELFRFIRKATFNWLPLQQVSEEVMKLGTKK